MYLKRSTLALTMNTFSIDVEESGFAIVSSVLSDDEMGKLLAAVKQVSHESAARKRGGIRNLLDRVPEVRALAGSPSIRRLVHPILGEHAFVTRGTLFDKTPDANWKVPWHQDLTIAVQDRIEVTGFGPWTVKEGVHHVQPPTEVLESMLAVRIHLDDCEEENGPLKVIPGSHRRGRLTEEQIQSFPQTIPSAACLVRRGGALLMRPLLLHASSAAQSPEHRRVIHIEFASSALPAGLRWLAESV
jgi:ectoine hydroxylase-related dioxygenase (phytanoyl-CoA dioxygenase family)